MDHLFYFMDAKVQKYIVWLVFFSLFCPGEMEGIIDQVSGDLHFGPDYAILTMRPWASY